MARLTALAGHRRGPHDAAMRTTHDDAAVRLYHLDADSGSATTLLYGTLAEALARAASEPEEAQAGLFLQTSNDVVGYLEFVGE